MFDTFLPIERALGPVCRLLLRACARKLAVIPAAEENPDTAGVAFETALRGIPLPVSAEEVGRLLRAYVEEVPVSVIGVICARSELSDKPGPSTSEPYGVASGMVFAAVTRASYSARLQRFSVPRLELRVATVAGFFPPAPSARLFNEQSPPELEAAAAEEPFDFRRGDVPAQPDDRFRVWGVNSFARVPAFGGQVSEAALQQPGIRMPELAKKASPLRAAVVDFGLRRVLDGSWRPDGGSGSWLQKIRVSSRGERPGVGEIVQDEVQRVDASLRSDGQVGVQHHALLRTV